jgi:hypothetical protein
MNVQVGYCTNVHAGADLDATRRNLAEHALAVKQRLGPQQPLGIGLWLSASAAASLREAGRLDEFSAWLADVGLVPFTLNGFPYGDFHQEVVKHNVYRPTWRDPARLDYTLDLIAVLDRLLPAGLEGSISTLPLQWGVPVPTREDLAGSAAHLRTVADCLCRLEQERGRLIYLCLEPEPGCVLERCEDVIRYFEQDLLPGNDEDKIRRYLRVCHDVCHTAVMFEDQSDVLRRYRQAGIGVGKIQVSSAIVAPLDRLTADDRKAALAQLRTFAEDRYLHQTTIRERGQNEATFFADLPHALERARPDEPPPAEWRVHFHVPIYLERFGLLATSRDHIHACLRAAGQHEQLSHFEIETYAWGVLPESLRQPLLADGIARELRWFCEECLSKRA